MPEYLETTVDKFTFRVATDRLYTSDGVWVQAQGTMQVRVGLTDFVQQHGGDVAFAKVKPTGTSLKPGDELAELETMKVNLDLPSPVTGTIVEINKALELKPELINQDPFGEGWLAVVEASNWEADRTKLLDPKAYLSAMQSQAEQELKS
ncbi:MAG: glycine cleavage system protein H [Terriglobales bacterium]